MVEFISTDKEWYDHERKYYDCKLPANCDMNDHKNDYKKTMDSKHSKDIYEDGDDPFLKRKRQYNNNKLNNNNRINNNYHSRSTNSPIQNKDYSNTFKNVNGAHDHEFTKDHNSKVSPITNSNIHKDTSRYNNNINNDPKSS